MTRLHLRPRWSSRLPARLILAIGLLLIVIEGLRMLAGYRDDRLAAETQARAYLVEVTRQRAQTLASHLASVMQATRSAAWFLSTLPLPLDRPTLLDVIAGVAEQSPLIYGSAVAFVPASGHGAYYVQRDAHALKRIDYAERGVDYAQQDWFRRVVHGTTSSWSAPYFDAGIGNARMVTYSVPWRAPDGSAAVLTADIALSALDSGWSSPWGGATRIVDAQGQYLAHSGDLPPMGDNLFTIARHLHLPELERAGRAMQRGESGIVQVSDRSDERGGVWLSWAPISGTPWSLMALLQEDRVLANAREQLLHQLALSLGALGLVLATLVLVTRRLTRPLDDLRRVARAVRHGDHSQRTGISGARDEISQFAQAFDGMLDALDVSQNERLREAEQRQRIEGELTAARSIQRRLLPPPWPQWSQQAGATPGFAFHGLCQPATLMSGDFYDAWRLDADIVVLVVADVCGKGTPAALYMTLVRTHLRDFTRPGCSPAQTLSEVNRVLCEAGHDDMFVTLVLAHYHWRSGRLDYVCAGHPPPLLLRADGRVQCDETHSGLVGAFAELDYADTRAQLGIGDTLLLYSDGITEAGRSSGTLYGRARLEAQLAHAARSTPEALCTAIVADVMADGDPQLQDDITLLAVRRSAP